MSMIDALFPLETQRRQAGHCATCGCDEPEKKGFKDKLSQKEFSISGMCQDCQDSVFAEPVNREDWDDSELE